MTTKSEAAPLNRNVLSALVVFADRSAIVMLGLDSLPGCRIC
jgi:hypothetical protein